MTVDGQEEVKVEGESWGREVYATIPTSGETTAQDTDIRNPRPKSKREGFATVPDVTWSDIIGALSNIREDEELTLSVL
jgi:hypothetical protein